MSKIEVGRWSQQLRRMLGQAGQDVVAAELAPEISPTFELEGMSVQWNFLKGVRDVYVGQTIAAVALNVGKWRFRNPADSGMAAVFSLIRLVPASGAAALAIRVNSQTTDFATSQPTTVPDTRWGPLTTGRSAIVATFTNAVTAIPAGQTVAQSREPTSIAWQYDQEIFIPPGVTMDVGTDTANIQMTASFKWSERPFPVLER